MRVILINWAHLWDGASRGGGVNGYCQAIALELVSRGHEVISLCGGTTYEPSAGSPDPGPCRIQRHDDWLGIRVYEVINSPVLAPALPQFRDPRSEASAPVLEDHIARMMAELRPDVVHIHSLEGFSAGCVANIRRGAPAARILFSLHNYHTICPQVYLMQGHRRPCFNFDAGHACDGCIPSVDPITERRRLASGSDRPAEFEWRRPGDRPVGGGWRRAIPSFLKRTGGDDPSASAGSVEPPRRGREADLLLEKRPHPWTEAGLSIPAWRPLANDPTPEPVSAKAPNDYSCRRVSMIDALNSCNSVLAVSNFVARKFEALGVRSDRLRTLHIGTRMRETIARRPECLLTPSPSDSHRPIRLAFTGYNNWYKGLPMLADSLELLAPEVLGRFHLTVLALGGETMERQLRRLEPRLAGLTLRHGYEHDDLPWLLGGIDLGLVTSVWWDNGPQTVMEFLACGIPVLGANLGGIPDFISDGKNGLLFRGNDRWDLARRLAEVSRDPGLPSRLRAGIRPPKSIAEHTSELEAIYAGRVS
jgi:glycosyltransferase involved in cell wall biosynthesis